MIQEFGAEHVFDNHFEPHEPGDGSYVLHFREGGCLTRVTHVGGGVARVWGTTRAGPPR